MPAIGFTCTDEGRCTFDQCFKECRIKDQHLAGRCMPERTLRMIADQRVWTGKPSVTQLLKGTCEAYQELIVDYHIDPQAQMWRILGTKAHNGLDAFTEGEAIGEIRLELEGITGAFDFYDKQNLYDTKTYGSYKVMQALGLKQVDVDTGEVFKTGAKKGQPKTRKETVQGEPDLREQTLQLNMYRLMLEDAGFPVKQMFLDVVVRDGGTYIAKGRGIQRNAYLIPIPRMNDIDVMGFFLAKRNALLNALEAKILPPQCSNEETWNGNKCAGYCNVRETCPYVRR